MTANEAKIDKGQEIALFCTVAAREKARRPQMGGSKSV